MAKSKELTFGKLENLLDGNAPSEQMELDDRTVYIRQLFPGEEMYEQVEPHLPNRVDELFAIMSADGRPMAFVNDREIAFAGARRNDLVPVSVH